MTALEAHSQKEYALGRWDPLSGRLAISPITQDERAGDSSENPPPNLIQVAFSDNTASEEDRE
jgi:hypothetical protein